MAQSISDKGALLLLGAVHRVTLDQRGLAPIGEVKRVTATDVVNAKDFPGQQPFQDGVRALEDSGYVRRVKADDGDTLVVSKLGYGKLAEASTSRFGMPGSRTMRVESRRQALISELSGVADEVFTMVMTDFRGVADAAVVSRRELEPSVPLEDFDHDVLRAVQQLSERTVPTGMPISRRSLLQHLQLSDQDLGKLVESLDALTDNGYLGTGFLDKEDIHAPGENEYVKILEGAVLRPAGAKYLDSLGGPGEGSSLRL